MISRNAIYYMRSAGKPRAAVELMNLRHNVNEVQRSISQSH